MQMRTYNRFVDSVIEERHVNSTVQVGRERGGGIKSLKHFAPDRRWQSYAYTREISIGGYPNAG
jgi:hypothetical protein